VSVLSGVLLVPFYSPTAAWVCLEKVQGGLAWGFFLRAMHAYSSFAVLVTLALHVVQVLAAKTERQLPAGVWWRSVLLLPVTIAALLGGFVLRGDAEAVAALAIWKRIFESLPFAGAELSRLFLGAVPGDLGAVALRHQVIGGRFFGSHGFDARGGHVADAFNGNRVGVGRAPT